MPHARARLHFRTHEFQLGKASGYRGRRRTLRAARGDVRNLERVAEVEVVPKMPSVVGG
ncbi:hypothetical protein YTPLAS18_02420 [Nitrospira sp.]|nr:hypothetical protein YTPLAS18_02420 [Nitrospira sp.]